MVRGSLGGREATSGSKSQGLPRWLPPSSFPHLTCLLARCPSFSIDQRSLACARLPGPGSLWSHGRSAVFLSVFWWADEESAGPHHRDEGAHFFHRSALDSCTSHNGPLAKVLSLNSCSFSFLCNDSRLRFFFSSFSL